MLMLKRDGKPDLTYVYTEGDGPCVVFCGGYRSDMQGTKATYFEERCKARGQAYLRFDYSGHGESGGDFLDGTIGSWRDDALAVFDHCVKGDAVIVGSSMGGWIGLLLAQARADQVKGFVGIAPAPDFTEHVYQNEFNDEQRAILERGEVLAVPNDYSDEPYTFKKEFFDEGRTHLLLSDARHHVDFPIRLFHGMLDTDVPPRVSDAILQAYVGDVDITFVDDGDHRLSRPQDLEVIDQGIEAVSS